MWNASLIEDLASTDGAVRTAAQEAIVRAGAQSVPALVAELCRSRQRIDWGLTAQLLGRIGLPAFAPVVDVIAEHPDPEVRRYACFALSWMKLDDLTPYAELLRHPSAEVRAQAAYVLQCRKERSLPHADALLALLRDEDEQVRQRGQWALPELGPGLLPTLQRIRAHGPGGLRRGALTALADIDPAAISERDRAAVRRLIRVKQRAETPEPVHLCGTWLAVRSTDQAAVLSALDLSDPEPVTLRLGESAWNHDHHGWHLQHDDHRRHGRAYVTPAVDGWTLVFGADTAMAHADSDDPFDWAYAVMCTCARLSELFGAAHLYGMSCGDGWTAWCLAEDGTVQRFYEADADNHAGPRHPAEEGFLLPDERPELPADAYAGIDFADTDAFMARRAELMERLGIPETCHATDIAALTSVDPSAFGPHTRMSGQGVLALTACGRAYGTAPGALRI
ncbi:HEAT repeat domain-containing protein [Catellatospora sp. NPDC049609]|uniref:HEAT repeat domain-containing protein n=1 Tax=Catellatospora sp. NPDC049609 TaxID=3155505 RepID=UPI00341F92D2